MCDCNMQKVQIVASICLLYIYTKVEKDFNGKVTDNMGEHTVDLQTISNTDWALAYEQLTTGKSFNTYTIRSFDQKRVKF
jgi:hypothetical protein